MEGLLRGCSLRRGWPGFAKKRLRRSDPEYFDLFVKETCRGELAHWIVILLSPLFFLWNPRYAGIIMIVYALAANMPCIIVQRYNRPQLLRILAKKRRRGQRQTAR